jgi:anti-anti-sigma factor
MASRVAIDAPPSPDGQVVLRLSGELDMSDADAVRTALVEAVRAGPTVVVDLSGLSFIDVAGMRALRDAHDAALACGCRLLLAAPQRCVRTLAALMDLGRLPLCEDRPTLDGGGDLRQMARHDSTLRPGGQPTSDEPIAR